MSSDMELVGTGIATAERVTVLTGAGYRLVGELYRRGETGAHPPGRRYAISDNR